MFNDRTMTLFRELCIHGNTASVETLAAKYGISYRMVRYDLNNMNDFLKENGFSTQIHVKKSEVTVHIKSEEKEKIKDFIDGQSEDHYILSQKERTKWIIFRLLHPGIQGTMTYDALCDELKISRSTLICDIRYVRNRLESWNLEMVSIVKKGFWCIGKEKAIRTCIRNILTGETFYAEEQLFECTGKPRSPEMELYTFFKEEILWLKEEIDRIQKELGVMLSDIALVKLMSVILIAVRRIRLGYTVDAFGTFRCNIKNRREYVSCRKLSEQLSAYYGITVPEDEIIYLMAYVISASKIYLLDEGKEDDLQADFITNKIRSRFHKITGNHITFSRDIDESFVNHIKSMIFRLEFDISVTNPFLDDIKQSYPQLFIKIANSCSFLEKYFGKRLSEHEIAYMVLYFQLALEEEHTEAAIREKNVIIICASGSITGKVIANKLKKHFSFHLIAITSCYRVQELLMEKNADLVISSIPVKLMGQAPVTVVSPMITRDDIDKLKKVLPAARAEQDHNHLMEEILSVVEENVESVQMEKIKSILGKNFHIKHAAAYGGIARILTPADILLNLEAADWREGIRLAAEPMKKKGIISDGYIKSMIETVEKLGAYIVVTEDIAIPHAAPGGNIYDFGITIVTFQEPITIIDRSGIKTFITFAMMGDANNRDIIMEIMELTEDEHFMELMYRAEDPQDIYQYIINGNWHS